MATSDSEIRTHLRSCAFCEAGCGIEVTANHRTREILDVRGDKNDPFSQGFICAKAYGLTALHSDPDRLRKPLRRRGRDFEEIGWEEAFDEAAERLEAIQQKQGRDGVAYYFGNPSGHKGPMLIYSGMLMGALGTRQIYSPGTLDQIPKHVSGAIMFGGPLVQPLADLDRTDHLIIIGSNPAVSQGSMIVAPGFARRIKAIRARGGRVVVIDPRRTETAALADEHVAIAPGSDAYLLMAMVQVLIAENRVTLGRATGQVKGYDDVARIAAAYPPERVAAATGVDSATIRRLARDMATAPSAVIHGRTGTCTQQFGTLASWLIDVLNTVTGNLDRPGGAMFAAYGIPTPILFGEKWRDGVPPVARWRSRATALPEAIGMLPTAALADEILTPGAGQVRGLVTQAGNILLSNPHGAKLAEAFDSLDFMLSLDIYLNETTRHADIIIPGPSYAEHSDFAAVTPYEMIRKYVKWAPPVFDPPPDMPSDERIFTELTARLAGISRAQAEEGFFRAMAQQALAQGRPECSRVDLDTACAALGDAPGADRIFDAMIRSGPYGDAFGLVPGGLTLDVIRKHPHGLDLGALTEQLPGVIETPDGLIDLFPQLVESDLPRLEAWLEAPRDKNQLLMIGRRDVRSKNAWMHNVLPLVKGRDRCTLLMNPQDAHRLGLDEGALAQISTDINTISAPVEISDEMRPGVVSLPHGWGHTLTDTRQRVANAHPGVNANLIIDPMTLDVPTATTVLNGVPVRVEKCVEIGERQNTRGLQQPCEANPC